MRILLMIVLCTVAGNRLLAEAPLAYHFEDGNDTIIIDLPNQSQVIIVVDNIAQLAQMGEVSIDSIIAQIGQQLNANPYPGDTVMDFYLDPEEKVRSTEPKIIDYDLREAERGKDEDRGKMLNFGLNWGGGLIRNILSPGVGATVSAKIAQNEFGAGVRTQYFFEKQDDRWSTYVNTFVTGSYAHNFSKDKSRTNWHEISFGYLVGNNGDYFGENTFVLSYGNEHMKIRPELYVTDNFRSIFPGFSFVF